MPTPRGDQEGTVSASEFEARCLALIERVAKTRLPLLITKDGKPVARIVPAPPPPHTLAGSVTLIAERPEDYYSTGEPW